MVQVKVYKYGLNGYEPVITDEITEQERDMLLSFFKNKPKVEGFYQYVIPQPIGDPQVGYTINPDLINYLKSKANGNERHNTSANKED